MHATRQHADPRPPTVLIVDDNPDTLEMYALGLRYEGFDVCQADDAERAIASLEAAHPDCIVTDVRMPRMSGLEFRRVLAHNAETTGIPVIALTGAAGPGHVDTARAAGFDSVLLKPCLPETLAQEILRVIGESRAARRRAAGAAAVRTRSAATHRRHQRLLGKLKNK